MAKRPPFVAVETDMRKSEGLEVMAQVLGCNRQEALGRLVELWMHCADRRLQDAPEDSDGYAVSEQVVRYYLGDNGVQAILADGIDAFALGAKRPDGLIALRKTERAVSTLRSLTVTAPAGAAGRMKAGPQRNNVGRFTTDVSQNTNIQPYPTHTPAEPQPITADTQPILQPNPSHVPPSSTVDPDPRSQIPDKKKKNTNGTGQAHEVVEVRDLFHQTYLGMYGTEPTWGAGPINALKGLISKRGKDEVCKRIVFMRDHTPTFPEVWDIKAFVGNFDRLVPVRNGHAKPKDPKHGRIEAMPPENYPEGEQKW